MKFGLAASIVATLSLGFFSNPHASAQLSRQSTVNTLAGSGVAGYATSQEGGPATAAQLSSPHGVVMDVFGNLYIADTANNRIRKVDAKTGSITTVAGNGTAGYRLADENVVATFGELNAPQDVALDDLGNLYIADTGNHRVRKVVLSTGVMTTFAGTGATTYNQQELGSPTAMNLSQPTGISVDPVGDLYIADAGLNRVFLCAVPAYINGVQAGKIATFAGNGTPAYTTSPNEENVNATLAHLSAPASVFVDRNGVIFIADTGNKRVRKVVSQKITTVAGNGGDYSAGSEGLGATSTGIGAITSVRTDVVKNMYLSLPSSNRILMVSVVDGKVTTFAGNGVADFADNAVPPNASFSSPAGLTLNGAGTLYIADSGNHRVRSIPVATGNLLFATTSVGSSDTSHVLRFASNAALTVSGITVLTPAGSPAEFVAGSLSGCSIGGALSPGSVCSVPITFTPSKPGRRMVPIEVVTSAGTQRFGLSGVGTGPLVLYSPGSVSAFAGATSGSYTASEDNGPATAAHFLSLDKLGMDGADNVYVSDTRGSRIRKITPAGIVSTVAGNGSQAYVAGDENVSAMAVGLASPSGVAVDAAGNIYIADASNGRIRRVDAVTKKIVTVAGNGTVGGASGDGVPATSTSAGVTYPLLIDQQENLYFGDSSGRTFRVDAATGYVNPVVAGYANAIGALGSTAKGNPIVDDNGVLYLALTGLYRANFATGGITNLTTASSPLLNGSYAPSIGPNGDLMFLSANGGSGSALFDYNIATASFFTAATYTTPPSTGFVLDSSGNAVFQSSASQYQLIKGNSQDAKLAYSSTVQGQTSSDSPKTVSLYNIGGSPLVIPAPDAGTNPSLSAGFRFGSTTTCPQLTPLSAPFSLAASAGCAYSINFVPQVAGSISGLMLIADNQYGAPTPVTQTMSLSGTATAGVVTTSIALTGLANTIAGTAQTVTVTAYDASHAVAATYRGTVTFSSSDTASGVLPAPYTFTSADAGVHTFTVTLKTASDRQTVSVTDGSNSALISTAAAQVDPAAAVSLSIVQGTPQSAFINTQFITRLRVKVADTYGNGVPNVSVVFAFPTTGASATPSSTGSVITDSDGTTGQYATANNISGTYNVTATASGISLPVTFVLTNKPVAVSLSVSASGNSIAYGNDVRITAKLSPTSVNGKAPTGSIVFYEENTVLGSSPVSSAQADLLVTAPTVGDHVYSASYVGDANYDAADKTSGSPVTIIKGVSQLVTPFTQTVVRPGTVTIHVGNGNLEYVQPSGAVNYTLGSACGSTPASGALAIDVNGVATLTVPPDCPARVYDFAISYVGDSNYNAATSQHIALTVVAQTVTVVLSNLDQVYDGSPKPVTVTTTPANIAVSINYNGSGTAPTLAGLYSIVATVTDPNYSGSQTAALLVRRGPVAITWPDLSAIVYGMPLTTTQLSASASVQGTFSYNPIAGTVLTPGAYTLNVTFTPNDSPSTPTTATQRLTVTKAPLTVKAVDAGRLYNSADPSFTASITGAVNGDTFDTGGATTATLTSPVGQYPISPTISGQNLAFYNVTSVPGTLTVSGTPATILFGNLNQTYDGSAKPVTVTTSPAGLPFALTYAGSTNAPTLPGSYPVVATITDGNYTGVANGVLVISAGAAEVNWPTPPAIVYGTALGAAQLNASSPVPGAFVYSPAPGVVPQPGVLTLSVTFTPSNSSLLPVTKTVTLQIDKANLTLTANNVMRHVGEANPPLTGTVVGAVNGDVLSTLGTTTATVTSPIGIYAITPVLSGVNAAAYNVTYVNGTLTVIAAASSIQLTSATPTAYLGDTVEFTAVVSGGAGTPSGSVEFFEGTTSLGVKTLSAARATLSTITLAVGTHNITAVYSGDATFSGVASPLVVQTTFPADYTIAVNPTVLTIKRGETGLATFTVTPLGNFHDTIYFACASLPSNATCSFAPSSLTPNGIPLSTTLTISTTAQHASLEHKAPWEKTGSGITVALLLIGYRARRRRRMVPLLLAVMCSVLVLGGITGCATVSNTTPAGTYPLTVSAGVSTTGGGGHSVSLTINIVD